MQIRVVSANNNCSFGNKISLSPETIKSIEKSTKLTYEEMTTLSLKDTTELMEKRGSKNSPNKFFLWFADKYKKLGEKLGFLEKDYNFYTEID